MLGKGLYTPWLGESTSGRSFTDRKNVSWDEIKDRVKYYSSLLTVEQYEAAKRSKAFFELEVKRVNEMCTEKLDEIVFESLLH